MKTWAAAFDLILALGLLLSARQALFARALFQAVAFFIAFGVLMALAWTRLGAPDVALAEAAIGTGLTGALLLDAARQLGSGTSPTARPVRTLVRWSARITSSLLGAAMILALIDLRAPLPGLLPEVQSQLPHSGAQHPMTAVLLNFRAWDTWLELGVLFLAALSILVIHRTEKLDTLPILSGEPISVLRWLARKMLPLLILIGGYLLWAGARSPGGAFQAGALMGAAGVLMQLGGVNFLGKVSVRLTRWLLILGFTVFSITALMTLLGGRPMLEYPRSWAGSLILLIEFSASASIAFILLVVYSGSRPGRKGEAS